MQVERTHTPTHIECCFETLAPVDIPSGPTGSSISEETLAGHMLVLKYPPLAHWSGRHRHHPHALVHIIISVRW